MTPCTSRATPSAARQRGRRASLGFLCLATTGLVACAGMEPVRPGSNPARPDAEAHELSVSGAVLRPRRFDLAALQALPALTQTSGGHAWTGVSLWSLLAETAGIAAPAGVKNAALSMVVVARGADGYRVVFSLAELDPGFGNQRNLVAYASDGASLAGNGFARLVVPGDGKGGRQVARLVSLEVVALPPP